MASPRLFSASTNAQFRVAMRSFTDADRDGPRKFLFIRHPHPGASFASFTFSAASSLPAHLAELLAHLGHAGQRLGVLAHVLGDLHRAELRPAHRAEVGVLVPSSGRVSSWIGARGLGIERQVELVFPAELEARLARARRRGLRAPGWPLARSAAWAAIL